MRGPDLLNREVVYQLSEKLFTAEFAEKNFFLARFSRNKRGFALDIWGQARKI
jgi:hypothetical protein